MTLCEKVQRTQKLFSVNLCLHLILSVSVVRFGEQGVTKVAPRNTKRRERKFYSKDLYGNKKVKYLFFSPRVIFNILDGLLHRLNLRLGLMWTKISD